MEQGLNLALQFIKDVPKYKFPLNYYEADEELDNEKERDIIKPRPGAETAMISTITDSGNTRISVYWDLSYGAVLVKAVSGEEQAVKPLNGIIYEHELPPFQQNADLGITSVRILKYQLEFAKDRHGRPHLIIIQTINSGVNTIHCSKTWNTLVYNLDGNLLFTIGGEQELRSNETIQGWMNWMLTPDGKWIILWQPNEFQPIFHRISDLEARLAKTGGYHLQVDRLDWLPKISPFPVSNIIYIDKLTSRPEHPSQLYSHEPITLEAYRDYLLSTGDLDGDVSLEEAGYLIVYTNDLQGQNSFTSSDNFADRLGLEQSHGHKSTDIPITNKGNFMLDLHRRRLMPNS